MSNMDKRRVAIFSYQEYEIDIWYKMDTYTQCIGYIIFHHVNHDCMF